MWPYRKTNDKRLKQKNTERSGSDRITSYASRKKMEVTSSDQSSLKGHCTAWDMYPLTSPPLGNRGSDNPNPRHHLPQPPSLSPCRPGGCSRRSRASLVMGAAGICSWVPTCGEMEAGCCARGMVPASGSTAAPSLSPSARPHQRLGGCRRGAARRNHVRDHGSQGGGPGWPSGRHWSWRW
jgi:hypothetical protein